MDSARITAPHATLHVALHVDITANQSLPWALSTRSTACAFPRAHTNSRGTRHTLVSRWRGARAGSALEMWRLEAPARHRCSASASDGRPAAMGNHWRDCARRRFLLSHQAMWRWRSRSSTSRTAPLSSSTRSCCFSFPTTPLPHIYC
jgi:hypothetical protein|eukprot:COSAG03_NODE_138_length_11785_cov_22.668835_8_plen_148_part_00